MLIIREEQMRALERSLFESWVADHLRRFFPKQCELLGPTKLVKVITYGIQRARRYGFVQERDVCRYLDIMLVFGDSFDQDLLWAEEILNDARLVLPSMRMDLLHEAAVEHEPSPTV